MYSLNSCKLNATCRVSIETCSYNDSVLPLAIIFRWPIISKRELPARILQMQQYKQVSSTQLFAVSYH